MDHLGPASHYYVSQRLRLHYVDWGNPDAPPLLLLHGGRDHCRNWDWAADELRHDWHVIAPDLRGHGDSQWVSDGNYDLMDYVYDLAQLVDQLGLAPTAIVGHSLGGNIAIRYAGLYPDNVRKLVAIEGLGNSPQKWRELEQLPMAERMRAWIAGKRAASGRQLRRYPTLGDAFARMRNENPHLSEAQARHLTIHGVNRNEDGSYSWKFDNHHHVGRVVDVQQDVLHGLWAAISCPTLLCYGENSWASNPEKDGRMQHFRNARLKTFPDAGHWLHHDQFDAFMRALRDFL